MRIMKRNIVETINAEELQNYIKPYQAVCVDIGTGDGKRLYRVAKSNPNIFYIGIDPVKDNMVEISKRIAKKPEKGGLQNIILVLSSVENLPEELLQIADEVTVYFPWGTLLESIVKPIPDSIKQIYRISKSGAEFTFVTAYQTTYEENEINKRSLPELSCLYFETDYSQIMKDLGFVTEIVSELTIEEVKSLGTQWAKRLGTGRLRQYFKISGHII